MYYTLTFDPKSLGYFSYGDMPMDERDEYLPAGSFAISKTLEESRWKACYYKKYHRSAGQHDVTWDEVEHNLIFSKSLYRFMSKRHKYIVGTPIVCPTAGISEEHYVISVPGINNIIDDIKSGMMPGPRGIRNYSRLVCLKCPDYLGVGLGIYRPIHYARILVSRDFILDLFEAHASVRCAVLAPIHDDGCIQCADEDYVRTYKKKQDLQWDWALVLSQINKIAK